MSHLESTEIAAPVTLHEGIDVFTPQELLAFAAVRGGIPYDSAAEPDCSGPIASLALDEEMLNNLKRLEFYESLHTGPSVRVLRYYRFPSQEYDFWSFHRGDTKAVIELFVRMSIAPYGVVMIPWTRTAYGAPEHEMLHHKMWCAANYYCGKDMPALVGEIARCQRITVSWKDLGLDGLRRMDVLFKEFAGEKTAILGLARAYGASIFVPNPYPSGRVPGDDTPFVAAHMHAALKDAWRRRLDAFRETITLD